MPRRGVNGFNATLMGASRGVSGFGYCLSRPGVGPHALPEACAYASGSQRDPSPGLVSTCLPLAGEGEVHEEQVQRDDDGRDEETRRAQGTIVRVIAHDLGRGGQAHERDDREGDTEG